MLHDAASLAADLTARSQQSGTVDLQAGADPNFGSDEKLSSVQAASALSFGNGAKTKNVKAVEHFLIRGGAIAKAGDVVLDMPVDDAKYVIDCGKGVEATDEEVAAAQKAAKK